MVAGQARSRPSRWSSDEVDAEDEPERQPDHGDHEEPDDAQSSPRASERPVSGCPAVFRRRPGTAYFTTAPSGEDHERDARRATQPAGSPTATAQTDDGGRDEQACPGRSGTHDPDQPHGDGEAGHEVDGAPPVTLSEARREAPAAPGPRRSVVRRRVRARLGQSVAGGSRSLPVSSWTLTAIVRSFSPCSRAWWAQKQQLATAREVDPEVGLGAAAVAAVAGGQGAGCNGSGHGGLPSCRSCDDSGDR